MKTDLNLLLECLKYQMDNALSQKEALVTIYSICQQNTYVQKYFISVGGLDILSQVLVQLESDSHKTPSSAKLAVVVTKTMDACIADNQENQYDLFKNNGLPLMIQALTESQNEELNKAATFVLYNCKKITEKLSLSLGEYSFDENEAEQLKDINVKGKNLEEYWKIAKEILHKIDLLEKEENKENIQRGKYKNISSMKINIQDTLKHLHADTVGGTTAEDKDKSQPRELQSSESLGVISKACASDDQTKTLLKNADPVNALYTDSGQNKALHKATSSCNQNLHEETIFSKKNFISQSSDHAFKHPTHVVKNSKQQLPETEKRRTRKNFTEEEVNYLLHGVKKMGNHWNSILWSFPFQQGRTAVDLAHKYHKLVTRPKCAVP
ncbi:Coiled-coil domain-containing protein 79 [Heterocephalus glaber]|uniref:Telomere repeats-binding bouquet formation protein 1 n=1 Tax=Heterocephalus glaber TaxID=10181 RepID=G5BDH1_HETGA|nr:Coiled-coil domain-containing protein 79 [Heterocephalus glaber]